jgi:hypothetical protein
MRNSRFQFAIFAICAALFISCSDDGGPTSNIEAFAGTYVGKYRALVYDTENDTMVVTVDAANDKITFTSTILGTSFEADYDISLQRAIIRDLSIDTLRFVQGAAINYAYNTTVGSGYCEMRGDDTKLYIQLNNCRIEEHTIDLLPSPLTIPVVNTPNSMNPL